MGFFTRTAMDMLMKTTHPEINRRQCWNLHPHRKPCTECKDICPYGEQIFTRPNLVKDWDPCTECGSQRFLNYTGSRRSRGYQKICNRLFVDFISL